MADEKAAPEVCVRCGSKRSVKERPILQPGGVTYSAKLCAACATELKAAAGG